MATVRIQGVPFELDDAGEFAKRLKRASYGASKAGLSPAQALAIEIDEAVNAGGGEVPISDDAGPIAGRLLDEWGRIAPDSAKQLRYLLAS